MTRLTQKQEHDLSHRNFAAKTVTVYSAPMDCENAVYTPPQGEKATNPAGG